MTDSARSIVAQAYHAYKDGDVERARSLVRQALALDPENANAWYVVGLVSSEEKNKRPAFEKAIALDPTHKYARAALEALALPLDPADYKPTDYASPRPSSPSIPTSAPSKPTSTKTDTSTKQTMTTTSERVLDIANRAAKSSSGRRKKSASVGWVLPSLVVLAAIGLVAVIVMVLRSRPTTLAQPTAAALTQATLSEGTTEPTSETPAKTETVASGEGTPTADGQAAVNAETGSGKDQTGTPTATLTPSATLNMVTLTPSATRVANISLTGQILFASPDDLYSVNVADASVTNLTNRSQSQIRTGRWSPDRQHILLTANGALVITDAGAGAPRKLDTVAWRAYTADWSPDGTQIAFIGYDEQRMDSRYLFVVNADGTDLKQITPNPRQYESLDWGTDGIVYSLGSQNSVGLWVISPTGGEPTMVASSGGALEVMWSPYQQRILFRSTRPNMPNTELFVAEAGNIRDFPNILGSVIAAAWSPDGTKIAFAMLDDAGEGYSIFVTAQDGRDKPVRVATRLAYPMSMEWIGDGGATVTAPALVKLPAAEDAILFVRSLSNSIQPDKKHTDLLVLNADGTQSQLTNFMQNVSDPAWSPDGTRIAVAGKGMQRPRGLHRVEEAPSRIYIMNADGNEAHQVTPELPEDQRPQFEQTLPVWSPDGTLIAYLHSENAVTSLRVMDTQGALSMGSEIGTFTYVASRVSWSPDGRRIALAGTPKDMPTGMYVIDADGNNLHLLTDFPGSQPVWSPDGTKIAFIARVDPSDLYTPATIYVMDSEGRNPQRLLTEDFEAVNSMAWSADGLRIVFSADRNKFTHLYLMNSDGSGVQALTTGEAAEITPQWKPKAGTQVAQASTPQPAATAIPEPTLGGLLAYTGNRGNGLCLAKLDGSDARCTQQDIYAYSLRWSPDGTRLAYVSDSIPNTNIYVAEADGSVKQLTTEQYGNNSPVWSPDGQRIAFISRRAGAAQIFVMNADGSDQHVLTKFDSREIELRYGSLAWSPDGNTILFILSPDANATGVYRMDADGSHVRKLNDEGGASLAYSPDGTHVAFVSYLGNHASVMVMNADGSNVQALTFSQGYNADPTWSPDGRFIVFTTTRNESNPANPPSVYIMGADGTDQHKIGELAGSSPAWGTAREFALPK